MNKVALTSKNTGVKNLRAMIAEAAQEVLSDPDFGLELSATAKKRLLQARLTLRKTSPLSEISRKYF